MLPLIDFRDFNIGFSVKGDQSPEKGKTFLRLLASFVKPSSFYRIKISAFFELFALFMLEYWPVSINVIIYLIRLSYLLEGNSE